MGATKPNQLFVGILKYKGKAGGFGQSDVTRYQVFISGVNGTEEKITDNWGTSYDNALTLAGHWSSLLGVEVKSFVEKVEYKTSRIEATL